MQIAMKSFQVMNLATKDKTLKANEYRVFMYLADKAGNETAECFVLHSTVGGDLGLHADTVRRIINRLVSKGYILKQQVKQKYTNNNSANVYTICQMLDEASLKIKKKIVELFPIIKRGAMTDKEMKEIAIEKIKEELQEETEEVVEEPTVEEVSEESTEETEEVPTFRPTFEPRFQIENQEETEEVAIEEVIKDDSEDKTISFIDMVKMQFENSISAEVESLMELVKEYGIIATKEQMKTLIHRFDIREIRKSLHRAFAYEFTHFNFVRKDLEGRLR